jgi:hypothetical protein
VKRKPFAIDKVMVDIGFTVMALFAAMLAIIVQTAQLEKTEAQQDAAALKLGNIVVEARWPDGSTADVDLWVKAPRDDQAVGYSRRADRQTAYTRDDIGTANDPGEANYENAFIRGLFEGRYIVDVHLYAKRENDVTPVIVTAMFTPENGPTRVISKREVKLTEDGQEVTAFSFELNEAGALVEGSISEAYIPLRNPGGQTE